MKNMEFPQELITGDDVTDEHHKDFFVRSNMFYNDREDYKSDKEKLLVYLLYLEVYTMEHFLQEEDLMEEKNYPDLDNHRKCHRTLYGKFEAFRKSVEKSNLTFLKVWKFNNMFLDWLKSDIRNHDMKLAEFLKK